MAQLGLNRVSRKFGSRWNRPATAAPEMRANDEMTPVYFEPSLRVPVAISSNSICHRLTDFGSNASVIYSSGISQQKNAMPQAFTLHVPDAELADLRERLARTRFPNSAPGDPWAYGTSVDALRGLVEYWRGAFDWRAQEARLNAFPQFRIARSDYDLHFLHVPGKGPDPMPFLLMHGWPGSVFEFMDFIPRLADPAGFGGDPADAFTVVAPSLPGFGLSFRPGQKRFGVEEIADILVDLSEFSLKRKRRSWLGSPRPTREKEATHFAWRKVRGSTAISCLRRPRS